MKLVRSIVLAALLSACAAPTATAQGTGRSLDLDLSIRSSGAGGAATAVFWGGDPNHWANPALLGYLRGATWQWGKTQLVPDLADDVFLESRRATLSLAGVTWATAGKGPGEIRLDYGESEGRDETGTPTGTFRSFEEIESWGLGISLAAFADAIAAAAGRDRPGFTRHVDVALGVASKDVVIALAPGLSYGTGRGTGVDRGLLVRVSPIAFESGVAPGGLPLGIDLAYGWSVLNANDERIVFLSEDAASPLTRMHRNGLAARVAMGWPASLAADAPPHVRWLLEGLQPLIALGVSRDWEHNSAGGEYAFYDVDRVGLEITIANLLAWRIGHVSDKEGDIDGGTIGWGAGVRLGRVAGFRYDRANVPQATGLDDVERKGVTVFVDLVALVPGRFGRAATAW